MRGHRVGGARGAGRVRGLGGARGVVQGAGTVWAVPTPDSRLTTDSFSPTLEERSGLGSSQTAGQFEGVTGRKTRT